MSMRKDPVIPARIMLHIDDLRLLHLRLIIVPACLTLALLVRTIPHATPRTLDDFS